MLISSRWLNSLSMVLALVGACAFASAQEAPEELPPVEKLVSDLGSDNITLRMEAELKLTEGPGLALRDLEAAIKTTKLDPEQRLRLLAAANARFCMEPRAAMGIQPSNMDSGQHGLVLGQIMRGFPSKDVLRVNDRLLSVDDQTIGDILDMQRVIFSHDPGDEVPVVLTRDGATLHLRVKLGRFEDLRQSGQLTVDTLERAWQFRCRLYPGADVKPSPIESGISDMDWKTVARPDFEDGGDPLDARARLNQARFQDDEARNTELVAGGESRGAVVNNPLAVVQALPGPNFRVLPGDPQFGPRDNARREAARQQWMRDEQVRALRRMIDQNNSAMKDLPEAQKQALIQQNLVLQAQIDQMEARRPRELRP